MTRRIWAAAGLLAILVGAAIAVAGPESSSAQGCGDPAPSESANQNSEVASGRGVAGLVGNKIVLVDRQGNRDVFRHAGSPPGMLRHLANRSDVGTAYVNDLQGADSVVIVTPEGVSQIAEPGEATNPAWGPNGELAWALDMESLRILSNGSSSPDTIPAPQGASAIFSPLVMASGEIFAVVKDPVEGDLGHDDMLNNLYRYDETLRLWTQVTTFASDGNRWSLIRTPILDEDGSILFVRIEGVTTGEEPARYELWRLVGDAAEKVMDLPGEMFLADIRSGVRIWNVEDPETSEWHLAAEGAEGLEDLGCGAVAVDPRTSLDPDLLEPERGIRNPLPQPAHEEAGSHEVDLAVLLGHFSTRQEAVAVARLVELDPFLTVVNHQMAPAAVAPGDWAVVWRLQQGADLQYELVRHRAAFPGYADHMWIAVLGSSWTE